jgi:hypothetical protein
MNICIKYHHIGRVIDEINENFGSVMNVKKINNIRYELSVQWNCIMPKYINIYTKNLDKHWYIEPVRVRQL